MGSWLAEQAANKKPRLGVIRVGVLRMLHQETSLFTRSFPDLAYDC
jgi:hypothetical protein